MRTSITTTIDVKTHGLSEATQRAIIALPFVEPTGHPHASTLQLKVPTELAQDLVAEIEALCEEETLIEAKPEPAQLPEIVRELPEVILPTGHVGRVKKSYTKHVLGRPETCYLVELAPGKFVDAYARFCERI